MATDQQNELWKSVEESNFGQYFKISEAANLSTPIREGKIGRVPVRVYIKQGKGSIPGYLMFTLTIPRPYFHLEVPMAYAQTSNLSRHADLSHKP